LASVDVIEFHTVEAYANYLGLTRVKYNVNKLLSVETEQIIVCILPIILTILEIV
jgi:hypothetical protein